MGQHQARRLSIRGMNQIGKAEWKKVVSSMHQMNSTGEELQTHLSNRRTTRNRVNMKSGLSQNPTPDRKSSC
jgi:hypothetical protein